MTTSCAYKDCFNLRRPGSRLVFFKLPVGNVAQRELWINNSGNPELKHLAPSAVRQFCEEHFQEKDIRRQFHRAILARDAVPVPYGSQQLVSSSSGLSSTESINFVKTGSDSSSDVMVVKMDLNQPEDSECQYEVYEIDEEDLSAAAATSTSPPLKRKRKQSIVERTVEVEPDKLVTDASVVDELIVDVEDPVVPRVVVEQAIQATPTCFGKGIQTDPETKRLANATTNTDPYVEEVNPPVKDTEPKVAPKLDEDEYFCLNVLCGLLKKIPQAKKAETKMNLLTLMYKADTQD